ncbi:hypothetical protein ACM0P6_11955 [Komagataeibacter sucrofermentans]|uniref:Uncharacterized protein n=1 Tax=Komagataeibacter sucrofermentans TaxID=1053551 RepID=A0A318QG93_9PROT|nr:hypothetical protein [Komagataeibacter sucrofermentans]PYD78617.1 hypothetical protein CFR77_10005 [Komagataeibacter sucrofermentans]GBQ49898.1 hypothetical protein AA15973_1916 [Komagataeibacter sucrofermentans DSM 15973]
MDQAQAEETVARNAPLSSQFRDDSFLGRLHEEWVWDEGAFAELKQAITCLTHHKCHNATTRAQAFDIFSYIMSVALLSHCNPGDLYRIANMDTELFWARREDVQMVFDHFLGSWQFRQA